MRRWVSRCAAQFGNLQTWIVPFLEQLDLPLLKREKPRRAWWWSQNHTSYLSEAANAQFTLRSASRTANTFQEQKMSYHSPPNLRAQAPLRRTIVTLASSSPSCLRYAALPPEGSPAGYQLEPALVKFFCLEHSSKGRGAPEVCDCSECYHTDEIPKQDDLSYRPSRWEGCSDVA